MTPNQVTALRVAAAFAAVAVFTLVGNNLIADLVAVSLTVAAIALDGVDGHLARTRNLATPLGAQLDILGDRIVENLFFTFFAASGLISFWIPVFFFVRGTVTDFLRGLGARSGRVGFGSNSMLETWWARALVASRGSRASYATLKCVCFCALGFLLPLQHMPASSRFDVDVQLWILSAIQALVFATTAFCLLRAVPVVWEGRRLFVASKPKSVPHAIAQVVR